MAYILPDSGFHAETLTEEECVRAGGHCWQRTGVTLTSNPPMYPEVCKHCKKGRVAIPQEPFTYQDWPWTGP
jgi:hypothetical protein